LTRRPSETASAGAWEVAPDVFCLGPRGRSQTNVYFVGSGLSWALIDTGWAKDAPSIKQAAVSVFGAGTRPTSILLTHFHPDHAGSALQLARIWDCAVYLHPDELPLATGDFTALSAYAGPVGGGVRRCSTDRVSAASRVRSNQASGFRVFPVGSAFPRRATRRATLRSSEPRTTS